MEDTTYALLAAVFVGRVKGTIGYHKIDNRNPEQRLKEIQDIINEFEKEKRKCSQSK